MFWRSDLSNFAQTLKFSTIWDADSGDKSNFHVLHREHEAHGTHFFTTEIHYIKPENGRFSDLRADMSKNEQKNHIETLSQHPRTFFEIKVLG